MRGISFSTTVPADSSDKQTYLVEEDATVEKLSVRIYPGAETDLEIVPEIVKDQTDTAENLVRFSGKDYLDGDNDMFVWDLSVPVRKDDVIQIRATNRDETNAFDYRANVELDNRNGLRSFYAGVF